ncbi:hypothetical protein ACWKT4_27805 [Bacillus thuringiensis]
MRYSGVYVDDKGNFFYQTEFGIDRITGKRIRKKEYPYFEFYGNGDLLLHGGNSQLSVVKTNWETLEIMRKIRANFYVEI